MKKKDTFFITDLVHVKVSFENFFWPMSSYKTFFPNLYFPKKDKEYILVKQRKIYDRFAFDVKFFVIYGQEIFRSRVTISRKLF